MSTIATIGPGPRVVHETRGERLDRQPDSLVITGPTGVGKSWLASAIGQACRVDRSFLYQRVPSCLRA